MGDKPHIASLHPSRRALPAPPVSGSNLPAVARNNLPAARNAPSLPAVRSARTPPPPVLAGIRDLLLGFAAPTKEDDDVRRLLRVYAEAVDGYHDAVALHALQHLKFHNPRNPFRPSPQDVYEECGKTDHRWRSNVTRYFIEGRDWEREERHYWEHADLRAPPLSDGCVVPDYLVRAILKDALGDSFSLNHRPSRARCLEIPADCFASPEQRERMLQLIAVDEQAAAREAKERVEHKIQLEARRLVAAALEHAWAMEAEARKLEAREKRSLTAAKDAAAKPNAELEKFFLEEAARYAFRAKAAKAEAAAVAAAASAEAAAYIAAAMAKAAASNNAYADNDDDA